MTSSFAAQKYGSQNPHQNPVRSHRGGYLRCPFTISANFAELAEKRVREDLVHGGSGRGRTAVVDKDAVQSSSSAAAAGQRTDLDGVESDLGGRPWSRAGVGAVKLTGKEKRMQQEQAELIYGRGSLAAVDDDDSAAAATQENMFAVDARDQAALRHVVPRAVREKAKRRQLGEVRKERRPLGHHTRRDAAPRDEEDGDKGRLPGSATAPSPRCSAAADAPAVLSSSSSPPAQRSPRHTPAPVSASEPAPGRPKSRMQMLDDLRTSALSGKKRRR
ncbi:hypothetical protein NESM_000339800 [Novymonas esmeraldas]|uniref:Uncharacterized protein n=1 Tax=Novymonas esmeraldas TaxID=1808958 RepID=A0AAW0EKG0_9TRYP